MKDVFLNRIPIISLLICLFISHCYSSEQERFLNYTEIDGLPRNITTCLEQDQYGYLWVGTGNGIARYDGNNFYTFNELSGVSIISLLYDSQNNLWAASGKGLYRYNRLTNYFEHIIQGFITKLQEDNGSLYFLMVSSIYKFNGNKYLKIYSGSDLSDFCFSKEGIWISKSIGGVMLLSRESDFQKITSSYLPDSKINIISKIGNRLYAGCYNGQVYAIQENEKVIPVNLENHYYFKKITKVDHEIWLASDGNGIIVLDSALHIKRMINRNQKTELTISSNSIYDIYWGNKNEIWIATYGAGLTCILPDNLLFQNILPEKGNKNSLLANEGISIYLKNPFIYFGTNYGLSVWNETSSKFNNLSSDQLLKELKGAKVSAVEADLNGSIWIATYDGLLGNYTADFKLNKRFHPSSEGDDEMQQIVGLKRISKTNLLVLTQFHNRILLDFNIDNETTEVFELFSKGSKITYCLLNSLRENQHGELLAILSDKGLFHVNVKDHVIENRMAEMNQHIEGFLVDFYQDKKGNYWIATSDRGLLRISEKGTNIKKYTIKEGLPANSLVRIESADDRYLWIATIAGICQLDTQTDEVLNFNHNDGLPANEFLERVSAKTDEGKIIFGSIAGFTIVDPSKVNADAFQTEVVISDITIQNQSIRIPNGEQFLTQPLEDTKEIKLPYNKNSFSVHFFAKNKSYLKYHNYAYRLVGLEKDWTYLTETNFANYTNLNSGTYTFEVKSADKTKEGTITRLVIHIQSPWFLSWLAYVVYALMFLTLLYLSVYAYLKRMELRKEKEISDFKIQKEHELTEKKLAFFTSISHDLKTPLTLIDAPVNDLLQSDNLNKEQTNKLLIINRNSKRLYKLISDLIDFRKITQKQYLLEVNENSISGIITDVCEAFKAECIKKKIELKCNVYQGFLGYVDAKVIEKVLWNLLSNSLKFTKNMGSITLSAEDILINGIRNLKLTVRDNGIGISEEDISKIFDRFYKTKNSDNLNVEGTGIGLSIVKELIELHHGKIEVTSVLGSGSTFTIILPISKESYTDSELAGSGLPDFQNKYMPASVEPDFDPLSDPKQKQYNLPVLLLVEDNNELTGYLKDHYKQQYKVYTAEDGVQGLKVAKEINPDLILTDVQMPNMNGYEFCSELRHNFETSHIPVVMLTANTAVEQQIEGLTTGADVYLTKPFDIKLLDVQLNTLLENRKILRNKLLRVEDPENIEKSLPQKDIDFISELKFYIVENIMTQDLNIETISEHFAISHAQLHRKIKSLTGLTPNNLIKSIRLRKAYKLIREENLRVSEAAYLTGFNDPNYFTICFKKEFGENPSQVNNS